MTRHRKAPRRFRIPQRGSVLEFANSSQAMVAVVGKKDLFVIPRSEHLVDNWGGTAVLLPDWKQRYDAGEFVVYPPSMSSLLRLNDWTRAHRHQIPRKVA